MIFTNKVKRAFRRGMRDLIEERGPRNYRAAVCDENARLRAILNDNQRDGKIGFVRSGMDCDCTKYYSERVMDGFSSVAAFKKWRSDYHDSLEGPDHSYFVSPDKITPQSHTRDLAAEAFEDGHPHVVYY
jgi:hypothetical protein